MRIDLGNCVMRDWERADAPALFRHANNRKIAMWLRNQFPHPYTVADAEAFLAAVSRQSLRTDFAIAVADEAVGGIGLEFGRDVHRFTAEVGYWLGEPFWGRGIMTRAVRQLTAWAFDNLDLHRIYTTVFSGNVASARVLEKAGYEYEGCLRASVFKDGQVRGQLVYAKIRADLLEACGTGMTPSSGVA